MQRSAAELTIQVPSQAAAQYLESEYAERIAAAIAALELPIQTVRYVTADATAP